MRAFQLYSCCSGVSLVSVGSSSSVAAMPFSASFCPFALELGGAPLLPLLELLDLRHDELAVGVDLVQHAGEQLRELLVAFGFRQLGGVLLDGLLGILGEMRRLSSNSVRS